MSDWERRENLEDDGRICLEIADKDGFVLRLRGCLRTWMAWPECIRELVWLSMIMNLETARKEHAI